MRGHWHGCGGLGSGLCSLFVTRLLVVGCCLCGHIHAKVGTGGVEHCRTTHTKAADDEHTGLFLLLLARHDAARPQRSFRASADRN